MSILKDVSTLTNIPESALDKIFDRVEDAVIHNICENESDIYEEDICIGKIKIDLRADKYYFTPNNRFVEKIKKALNNKEDALIKSVENRVIYRVLNTYKDLL